MHAAKGTKVVQTVPVTACTKGVNNMMLVPVWAVLEQQQYPTTQPSASPSPTHTKLKQNKTRYNTENNRNAQKWTFMMITWACTHTNPLAVSTVSVEVESPWHKMLQQPKD